MANVRTVPYQPEEVRRILIDRVNASTNEDVRFYMRRIISDPQQATRYVDHCRQLSNLCQLDETSTLLDVG